MTGDATVAGLGLAPIAVWEASPTTRLVVPVDPVKLVSPEYAPEIVSLPAGAVVEWHEPLPFVNRAVQSVVDPVVNVTDPVGVGSPVPTGVTVAEKVTEAPCPAGFGLAPMDVCVDAGLTVRPVEPLEVEKSLSPEYAPDIVSLPTGAAVELHEPLPPVNGAVQSVVDPAENVTDPVGVGSPVAAVTVAE